MYGLASDGRFRKNWKKYFYDTISKISDKDVCNDCDTGDNLTRHHKPPLRETIKSKIIILCEKCHVKQNWKERLKGVKTISPFRIKCEKCNSYRYFLPKDKIQCEKCFDTIHLKNMGQDCFKIIESKIKEDYQ